MPVCLNRWIGWVDWVYRIDECMHGMDGWIEWIRYLE